MFKEITANTVAKAKEEVSVSNGVIVLIAVVSFLVGLIIGIVCTAGVKSGKAKKNTFNADDYARELNFGYDDEDEFDFDEEELSF